MKLKRLVQLGAVSLSLLALAACSTTGSNGSGSGAFGPRGLGGDPSLRGMDVSDSVLLRAPYNQSYYFDFNSSTLKPRYVASANAQGNYLVSHSSGQVLLAGNTDARGSREYNLALGEHRALAVANQLKSDGVSSQQINVISYGDTKPVALGNTEAAYAQNRRVDLIYKSK